MCLYFLLSFFSSPGVHVTFDRQSIIFAELLGSYAAPIVALYYFTVFAFVISVIIYGEEIRKKISSSVKLHGFCDTQP